MSYTNDPAEQVVRLSLEGAELAAKLTGAGAKQLAVLLCAIMRDTHKTKGKARLTSMLRSGKPLKVFAVRDKDLAVFCREAKKYGVLYCVLKDRDANDGVTDVMVRAEDAAKINRIFERFELAAVDMAGAGRDGENPTQARTVQGRQSAPLSVPNCAETAFERKPSVRQQLKAIREGMSTRKKERVPDREAR